MTTSTNNSVNTTAKINVTEGNLVIESAKVTVDEAVAILNRLNYMGATFQYRFTTREYNADIEYRNFDAYKADGTGVRFSLTEIVINGKLEIVRFHNHYRNIVVDLQVGNVAYIYGYKGEIEIVETDAFKANDAPSSEEQAAHIANQYKNMRKFADKLISVEYLTNSQVNSILVVIYADNVDAEQVKRLVEKFKADNDRYIDACAKTIKNIFDAEDKRAELDNKNVFDLLPTTDELNDVDEDEPTAARAQSTSRRLTTTDEHKPTVEIKTAKNGTKIFYADRKRVSRDTALKIAEQNRGENLFYLEWEHEVNAYYVGGGVESSFHTSREELRELNIKIDEYHGYTVKVNGSSLHTFSYKENAVWLVNAIIKAYVGGERGIKIERSGQVVIVDAAQTKTA